MARPKKPAPPPPLASFLREDKPPDLDLSDLQWAALAIEVEGFDTDPERAWFSRYSGETVRQMLEDRLGLKASAEIINRWRRSHADYKTGFFQLLDEQYWPSLKRAVKQDLRKLRNKNSKV